METLARAFVPLTLSKRRTSGRDSFGHIASYHRAGGKRRRYRCVDFFRTCTIPAIVKRFEFDPNRNASIALICYYNEMLSYIIAPKDLNIGTVIGSHPMWAEHNPGNCSKVSILHSGTFIHNLELRPNSGGKYMRTAGAFGQILKKYGDRFAVVKLRTAEHRLVQGLCKATVGIPTQYFNNYRFINYRSAGHMRRLGRRPVVRGVAMNPVDHPHGGAGGRLDRSPWGWLTKGPRTSNSRKKSWMVMHERRALGKRKIKNRI